MLHVVESDALHARTRVRMRTHAHARARIYVDGASGGAHRAERQSRCDCAFDYKGFQALHKDSAARCLLLFSIPQPLRLGSRAQARTAREQAETRRGYRPACRLPQASLTLFCSTIIFVPETRSSDAGDLMDKRPNLP